DAHITSLSGHKLGAVGGIGALVSRVPLWPLLPETPNPPGALSLAAALEAVSEAAPANALEVQRDAFEAGLLSGLSGVEVLGAAHARLPNTSCVRFSGVAGDGLMMALDLEGVAMS